MEEERDGDLREPALNVEGLVRRQVHRSPPVRVLAHDDDRLGLRLPSLPAWLTGHASAPHVLNLVMTHLLTPQRTGYRWPPRCPSGRVDSAKAIGVSRPPRSPRAPLQRPPEGSSSRVGAIEP